VIANPAELATAYGADKLVKKKAKAAKVKPVKVKKVAKNVDDVADIDAGVDDGVEEEVVVAKPKKAVVAVGGPTGKPRREVAL
jgi:citrate lyase synthetase